MEEFELPSIKFTDFSVFERIQSTDIVEFMDSLKKPLSDFQIKERQIYHLTPQLLAKNPTFSVIFQIIEFIGSDYANTQWYVGSSREEISHSNKCLHIATIIGFRYLGNEIYETVRLKIGKGLDSNINYLLLEKYLEIHRLSISRMNREGNRQMSEEEEDLFHLNLNNLARHDHLKFEWRKRSHPMTEKISEEYRYGISIKSNETDEVSTEFDIINYGEKLKINYEVKSKQLLPLKSIDKSISLGSGEIYILDKKLPFSSENVRGNLDYVVGLEKTRQSTNEITNCIGLLTESVDMTLQLFDKYVDMKKSYTDLP